jgi:uncharacterized membrane protein
MIHPAVAHFAISLPVISLVLGLLYIIKPSEIMSKISTRFLVFAAILVVVAYFTGKEDGGEVFKFLTSDGKTALGAHAKLGLNLAIAMSVLAVIKMFACFKKMFKVELLVVALLAVVTFGILTQGKMGGEITYTYGAHVLDHAKGQACIAEAAEMEDDEDDE